MYFSFNEAKDVLRERSFNRPGERDQSEIMIELFQKTCLVVPYKGEVIFKGEYPPGVFSSEKSKILRPLIYFGVDFETPYFFPYKFH